MKIKTLSILAFLTLLQACERNNSIQFMGNEMHNYDIYHQDRELSNLSVETGEFESGYKKLLQVGIFHTVKGGRLWRSSLEYKLFYKELIIDDLVVEGAGLNGFIQAYPKEGSLHPLQFFFQSIDKPLNFDNYAGYCSNSADSRGGVNCSINMQIEEMHVEISFDKSQIEEFEDFKKMTEEIVLDYLPKYAEKFK